MPNDRRLRRRGGTYFFTVVTFRRRQSLVHSLARRCLHEAIDGVRQRWPFQIDELVLLPDHFHLILTLPSGDDDFSIRLARIKSTFTKLYLAAGGNEDTQSASRAAHGYRAVWQKRYWEHWVRDGDDLLGCRQYCWFNPVKHGVAKCPHDWPWTTFHRAVSNGWIEADWGCTCRGEAFRPPDDVAGAEGE